MNRLYLSTLCFACLCFVLTGCQSSENARTDTAANAAVNSPANSNSRDLAGLILKDQEFSRLPETTKLTKQPYINGKIRILAKEPSLPGYRSYELKIAEDRLAKTPEEVGTVALLDFKQNKFGEYGEVNPLDEKKAIKANGYFWTCELTLIDRSIPAVIYKETFRGNKPDKKVMTDNPSIDAVNGEKPHASIIYFLNSTPLK